MNERELAHQLIQYVEATTAPVSHRTADGEPSTTRHPQPPEARAAEFTLPLDADATHHQANDQHVHRHDPEMIMLAPNDNEPSTAKGRWLLVAAVIAAVALVGGLIVAATGSDDDSVPADQPEQTPTGDPARSIPLTGADDDPAAQDAFAIVETAFAAYNFGDMQTWATLREGGWGEGGAATRADFADELARAGRLDVERCEYRGLGDWSDGPRTVSGHGFTCDVTGTDLFLQAAGIELEMFYNWVVAEDLTSSVAGSNEDFMAAGRFMSSYRTWLAANYPDVATSIEYNGSFPRAESVPIAAEYIEEFVADSDQYPLTDPVPPAGYYGGPLEPPE